MLIWSNWIIGKYCKIGIQLKFPEKIMEFKLTTQLFYFVLIYNKQLQIEYYASNFIVLR